MNDPVYRPVISAAKTLFFVQGTRFTITGEEHVPRTGGAVMAINHTSYLDFTYAGLPAWPHRRYVRFMAKKSIFGHRVAGPLMRGMRHIPVDRHKGGEAFAAAIRALRAGEIVGVFPEATMSRSFELKEFKPGAVKMAQVAGRAGAADDDLGRPAGVDQEPAQAHAPGLADPGQHHRRRAARDRASRRRHGRDRAPQGGDAGPARRPAGGLPGAARRRPALRAGPARRHRPDARGRRTPPTCTT